MIPKTIIHLLSGGLDSVTLLYDLHDQGHSIHCLLVDYGQKHKKELSFGENHCRRLDVQFTRMEIPVLGGLTETNWIVPNRNAILISLAVNLAVRANAGTVTIGCNKEDTDYFPDCRKEFLGSLNATVRAAGYSVEVCAPYLSSMKWQIGGLAREMGIAHDAIWSCYKGDETPCGECPACIKLDSAFK